MIRFLESQLICYTNDAFVKRFIETCGKLMDKGQFLHINFIANVLNLLVRLKLIEKFIYCI